MRTTGPEVSRRHEMEVGWVLVANMNFVLFTRMLSWSVVVNVRHRTYPRRLLVVLSRCASDIVCVGACPGHLMFLYL